MIGRRPDSTLSARGGGPRGDAVAPPCRPHPSPLPRRGRGSNPGASAGHHATRLRAASCASSSGSAFAQFVIEPAPRHTTMSPGRASARNSGASSRGAASGRALRCPCARSPATSASLRHAVDRRLAGRVHVGDQHHVGIVAAGAEPVEQIGEPRVAVRLHNRDHAARRPPRAPLSARPRSRPGGGRNRR